MRDSEVTCGSVPHSTVGHFPQSVFLWNDLTEPVFDGVGLPGFKSRANAFLLALLFTPILSLTDFPFSSSILWVGIVGLMSSDHSVDSVIESSLSEIIGSKNFALINLSLNFCDTTIYDNKVFLENSVAAH